MSIVVKSPSADFSGGPGYSTSLFVAASDLALAYDFSNQPVSAPTAWKTGLVGGQVLTAKVHDFVAHTTTNSDAGWSPSPSGLGIRVAANGYLDLGYSMPRFSNNDGVGRTFLALGAIADFTTTTWGVFLRAGYNFSNFGLALGIQTLSTPTQDTGSAIGASSNNLSYQMGEGNDLAAAIMLRADGATNWVLDLINQRQQRIKSEATLGIADPLDLNGVGGAGAVSVALNRNTSTSGARIFDIYAVAIWNRALTDAERDLQYERLRLRFKGVLN